jgi:hypothetical protein
MKLEGKKSVYAFIFGSTEVREADYCSYGTLKKLTTIRWCYLIENGGLPNFFQ